MIIDLYAACFDPSTIAVPEGPDVEFPHTQDHPHILHHHPLQENIQAGLLQDMLKQLVAHYVQMQNSIAAHNSSNELLPVLPPDLLVFFHLFHLARSPLSPWPSYSFLPKTLPSYANPNTSTASSVLYDPLFHFRKLQPQPSPMGELWFPYVGLPHEDNRGEIFVNGEGGMTTAMMMMHGVDEELLKMLEVAIKVKISMRRGGKELTKRHFATEMDRRNHFKEKFLALRDLIPNASKLDRASLVRDAIEYIKELLVTVNELKLLLERKRWGRERRCKIWGHAVDEVVEKEAVDGESSITIAMPSGDPANQSYSGTLRSSWLQRKSKATNVDVRIINDEATIKIVQWKKINCLLQVLDELQLDLHHVSGGHIGEQCCFLLNSKICECSTVYASTIASKIMEVVDGHHQVSAAARVFG